MGDTLDWWLLDGDWYDRKQQRAIEDLERTSARAHSANRSLQKQVEQNQASLGRRVDQLERALRAVVELEDVREELNEHVPAALLRRHARSVVMAATGLAGAAHNPAPHEALNDVPGYWLAPAVHWATSLLQSAPDQNALDEAHRRDPVRTDLFVVMLSAISDRSIDHAAALERLLARPAEVCDWQREVWAAVAARRFGSDMRSVLVGHLRRGAGAASREQLSGAVSANSASTNPVESGRRLMVLADRLAPAANLAREDSAVDDTHDAVAVNERDDRLAELLAVIVDEGAPGEVAVLDSMTDIRRVLADDASLQPPERRVVDDRVGEPMELLLADLGGDDAILRELAVDVFADDIAAWASELHDAAASALAPTTAVDVFGLGLEITAAGVAESEWSGQVEAAHPVEPMPNLPPLGGVGVLILLLGLLLVPSIGPVGFVVALVGLALAGWAGWGYWQQRESAQASLARRESSHRRTARQINEATKRIAAETADITAVASTIDSSLERIVALVENSEERATA